MRRSAILVAAALSLASALSACSSSAPHAARRTASTTTAPVPGWRVSPGQFVSLRFAPKDEQTAGPAGFLEVALSDVRTGAVIRRLLPGTTGSGMRVAGLALDRAGDLWVTYTKGPVYGGGVAGGDPHPHTCANEIDEVHAGTGRVTVFARTGDNVVIGHATPSPDGSRLAYTESGCTGYLDDYLRVTDLRSGRSWTIGHNVLACHILGSLAWSASGQALLAAYGPSSEQPAESTPQGVCPAPWAGRILQLNPGTARPGLNGATVRGDPGCQVTSVAGQADGGLLAVEACGAAPEYLDGPARLLVIAGGSHQVRRFALGRCADGSELATGRSGRSALVSVYHACGAKGTALWEYNDGALRLITTIAGDTSGASMLTWN